MINSIRCLGWGPLSLVALCAQPSAAYAHDLEANTVLVAPLPTDILSGSIIFATLSGPLAGPTVVHSELDLTFVTNGMSNASDVVLHFKVTVDDVFMEWVVQGSDLGWGTGPGTFSGTIDTDQLFGQVW